MNEEGDDSARLVSDTAGRLFADLFWPDGVRVGGKDWAAGEWASIEANGLPLALVPESAGGFGLEHHDALELVRIAGYHAIPLPFAETLFANWLSAICGVPLAGGAISIAISPDPAFGRGRSSSSTVAGRLERVPWGRNVSSVVVLTHRAGRPGIIPIKTSNAEITQGSNIASEPRDTLQVAGSLDDYDFAPLPDGLTHRDIFAFAATLRVMAMAGAIERILERTVQYATERVQFGVPIGRFQAIKHQIAAMAGHAAMASAAAGGAAELFGLPGHDTGAIGAAKVVCDEAAGAVAAIAHQVHGAIGFTEEHPLHLYTMRLWSWRDEFGSGAAWARVMGAAAAASGSDGLWPLITSA